MSSKPRYVHGDILILRPIRFTVYKFKWADTFVLEPAARLHMLAYSQSKTTLFRDAVSSKSRYVRRYFDTTVCTTLLKLYTEDVESRCEHSLKHNETINTLPIPDSLSITIGVGASREKKKPKTGQGGVNLNTECLDQFFLRRFKPGGNMKRLQIIERSGMHASSTCCVCGHPSHC